MPNPPQGSQVSDPGGLAIFGDGNDGNVTINANTTLTRDMFYDNLTVDATKILTTAGFRIFVKTKTINAGIIERDGNPGNGSTSVGAALAAGSLGGSIAGGVGGADNDRAGCGASGGGVLVLISKEIDNSAGIIRANGGVGGDANAAVALSDAIGTGVKHSSPSVGGNGGAGGAAGAQAGGPTGVATAPAAAQGGFRSLPFYILLKDETTEFLGGAGGGGGGQRITGGSAKGGGGGGGGGAVILIYNSASWGTEEAAGGVGGALSDAGSVGVNGSAGTVMKIPNI